MRNLSRWVPVIGGAIAGGVIALVIASANHNTTRNVTTTVTTVASNRAVPTALQGGTGMTINQIYRTASPGVVDILVTTESQSPSLGLFGGGGSQKSEDEGAGVVYNSSGDILTDEHVVAGATAVKVTFQDGREYPAKVVGTDASDDVGVIKVDAPASELHPIALADSNNAEVGDPVVAIGSPFSLPETATSGIVSQTGRSIQAPNGYTIPGAIQTDAPINPGNSGGPLLDASAHVLGLNDQIETNNTTADGEGSSSGVGFAIPSNTVAKIAQGIVAGSPVKHAYVGVCLQASSNGDAQIATTPTQTCPNVIEPGSPAATAGLNPGDVITAIDGKAVSSTDQFIAVLSNYKPGQVVTLTIHRQSQVKQVKVTLGVRPAHQAEGG